jgi:undecaprenyl diphosphate synthase
MVFLDTLFPDFDRRHLWEAVEIYARRDRRFGGAVDRAEDRAEDGADDRAGTR